MITSDARHGPRVTTAESGMCLANDPPKDPPSPPPHVPPKGTPPPSSPPPDKRPPNRNSHLERVLRDMDCALIGLLALARFSVAVDIPDRTVAQVSAEERLLFRLRLARQALAEVAGAHLLPARRDQHIEAVSDFLSVARTGGLGPNFPGRRMPTSAPSGGPGIDPPACSSEGRRTSGQGSTPSPEGQAVRPASLLIAPGRTAEAPEASQASGAGTELPDVLIGVADYAAGGR